MLSHSIFNKIKGIEHFIRPIPFYLLKFITFFTHQSVMFSFSTFFPFKNKLKMNAKALNAVAIQNASLIPSIEANLFT